MKKISNNTIKSIAALQLKKNRDTNHLFVVEGEKMIDELVKSNLKIAMLVAVEEWLVKNEKKISGLDIEIYSASNVELKRMSSMKTPNNVLAIVHQQVEGIENINLNNKLTLVLDNVQDPGNLGTIIRIADWFGIENVVCSTNTVELYNPKVIQSTMGAFLRVKVYYIDLVIFLASKQNLDDEIYGSFIDGENIYNTQLKSTGIIVMGNESKGISPDVEKYIKRKITIPTFNKNNSKTESLNVGVATAIVCSEFSRRT
jgi:RNA methyltransferase, TrmH family